MRQTGYLAAAGIYALDYHVERLKEDHANAKLLAEGMAHLDSFQIDPKSVGINIIYFRVIEKKLEPVRLKEELRKNGVLVHHLKGSSFRAVTHLDVSHQDVMHTLSILKRTERHLVKK